MEPTTPHILVVDLETTSLNEHRGSILQIGAEWLLGAPEANELQEFSADCHARVDAEIEDKALEVNGCSLDRVFDTRLPLEGGAIQALVRFVEECVGIGSPVILAGLNPSFDLRWLRAAYRRAGFSTFPFQHRTLDLHSLALDFAIKNGRDIPERGFYTDEIYNLIGLPPEPRPHVAIQGARAEAAALRLLLGLETPVKPFRLIV